MASQPILLAILACLTQYRAASVAPICILSIVIAIWLGLNNSARDLVRDRKQYVRERLAGLNPAAYLLAKSGAFCLIGAVQVFLLLATIKVGSNLVLPGIPAQNLSRLGWFWWECILLLGYACGLGLGLMASTIARTEEFAVALLPLLIMPQILLSPLGTGEVSNSYNQPRAFKPIIVGLGSVDSKAGRFVDCLSLLCYSRPAGLLLELPEVKGYSRWIWMGDLCHLMILLLGTCLLTYGVFVTVEQTWPRLIGLG